MIDPHTPDLYRQLHDDRAARLRSSMQRPPAFAARHAAGSWLVSVGLRLAPDAHPHARGRGGIVVPREDPLESTASRCVAA